MAARLLLNMGQIDLIFGIQLHLIQSSPVVQMVKMFWDSNSVI